MPEISEEDVELAARVLEHYHAYLVATPREDGRYQALAERLQRKGAGKEETTEQGKRERG